MSSLTGTQSAGGFTLGLDWTTRADPHALHSM